MTTIQIAYEVSDATVSKIEAHLASVAMRDVNWNGADFRIERDECTCIPDDDSHAAVALHHSIQRIISGEDA